MSVYRKTPRAPLTKQSRLDDASELGLAWDDDESGRLPLHIALPLILLLSVSCWGVVLIFVLWLIRSAS